MKDTIKYNKIDLLFNIAKSVTGVSRKQISSKKRYANIILPRHIVGYMLHKELEIPLIESGKIIGRDHSTIPVSYTHLTLPTNREV